MPTRMIKLFASIPIILLILFAINLVVQQCRQWQRPEENVQSWHYAAWMGFVASPTSHPVCLTDDLKPIAYSLLPSELWLEFNTRHLDIHRVEPDSKDKELLQAAILAAPDAEQIKRSTDSYLFARSSFAWDFARSMGDPPTVPTFAYDERANHLFVYFRPNEWQLESHMPVPVPSLLRTELPHEKYEYQLSAWNELYIVPQLPSIIAVLVVCLAIIWRTRSAKLRTLWFIFWICAYIPLVVGYTHCWLSYYQPKHIGLGFGLIVYPIINLQVVLLALGFFPLIFKVKKGN